MLGGSGLGKGWGKKVGQCGGERRIEVIVEMKKKSGGGGSGSGQGGGSGLM